jgi:hypothetical protein
VVESEKRTHCCHCINYYSILKERERERERERACLVWRKGSIKQTERKTGSVSERNGVEYLPHHNIKQRHK